MRSPTVLYAVRIGQWRITRRCGTTRSRRTGRGPPAHPQESNANYNIAVVGWRAVSRAPWVFSAMRLHVTRRMKVRTAVGDDAHGDPRQRARVVVEVVCALEDVLALIVQARGRVAVSAAAARLWKSSADGRRSRSRGWSLARCAGRTSLAGRASFDDECQNIACEGVDRRVRRRPAAAPSSSRGMELDRLRCTLVRVYSFAILATCML